MNWKASTGSESVGCKLEVPQCVYVCVSDEQQWVGSPAHLTLGQLIRHSHTGNAFSAAWDGCRGSCAHAALCTCMRVKAASRELLADLSAIDFHFFFPFFSRNQWIQTIILSSFLVSWMLFLLSHFLCRLLKCMISDGTAQKRHFNPFMPWSYSWSKVHAGQWFLPGTFSEPTFIDYTK